ncbi:uncharacterized protein PGTG_03036 [Puccinia graminis f. sp. tritici CRL 75-36-700-3]|uniref:PPM-type phosphatase domain-containing protein n=1 Tax=Puccinia graminis f. sp. tritici (strain CRL 75-36-700-3 / race SCCL) TaxID=418459 RepID=E3JYF5_PUCGT|nr:uncharacterized protein PGTG_03036 [Puccinia graminis f. sp. tritici CRL 75-36-700-3]EFP77080.2 hypothetical protein PGTG_03036 [Puccinia graminis f. sp. tritici CRL 75-36-700-3]
MGVDKRLLLSFLLADQQLISRCPKSGIEDAEQSGTIHPHFSSPLLSLVVAHLGNTSALLCSAIDGKVLPLTEYHHPDSRVESDRLRRIGTGLITDSFGESPWGTSSSGGAPPGSVASLGPGYPLGYPDIRQVWAEKQPSEAESAPAGGYPLALAGIRQRIADIRNGLSPPISRVHG